MNFLVLPIVLVAAFTMKAGAFSFYWGTRKYVVSVVATPHTTPLGKLTAAQAYDLAKKIAKGSIVGNYVIRIGSDDYGINVALI